MARPYKANSHAQATSTSTSDVQTVSAPTADGKGCYVTVSTNGCYMRFDGGTPSSTAGLAFPKDGTPVFFPTASSIKFVSQAAGNSVVNVFWVG